MRARSNILLAVWPMFDCLTELGSGSLFHSWFIVDVCQLVVCHAQFTRAGEEYYGQFGPWLTFLSFGDMVCVGSKSLVVHLCLKGSTFLENEHC